MVECQIAPESTADVSPVEIAALEEELLDVGGSGVFEDARLPEGVCFVVGATAADTRAELTAATSQSTVDAELLQTDPIFFYPDGTTSTSRLRLENEFGRAIELSLRGLTGVASVEVIQEVRK